MTITPPRLGRSLWFALTLICAGTVATHAMQAKYIDVNATTSSTPSPQVTFTWDSQTSGTIDVSRRIMGVSGTGTWVNRGSVIAPTTTFTDAIADGTVYEYRIHRPSFGSYYEVSSFVAVTLNAPLTDTRGTVLLVTDTTNNITLTGELMQLEMDLVGDGWAVQRIDSPPHLSGTSGTSRVTALKSAIQAAYNADPANIKAVYLFGPLPFCKSGFLNADGHASVPHEADGFYGDMDGTWTDSSINVSGKNVPNDGIYDQSYFPSAVELMVGRVDFSNMSAYHKTSVEYLRDYIHKSYAFRQGLRTEAPRKGSWNSSYIWAERNWIGALLGTANVVYDTPFQPLLSTTPKLFAVDFGNYDGTSVDYTEMPNKLIFGINFGSGKLFWANTNNPMRGLLAQPDWGLTCVWGARPGWFFHHMGVGSPVGYSALRTMNNNCFGVFPYASDYSPNGDYLFMSGYVNENLMGDPTLRLHSVAPPTGVAIEKSGDSALLSWTPSTDAAITGYLVYSSTNRLGPYTRLTGTKISGTSYMDVAPPVGDVYYQVRAIKNELTASATYENSSQGAFALLKSDGSSNHAPVAFSSSISAAANQEWEVTFSGSDADGDTLTPIVTKSPENGELRWNCAQVVYVPKVGYSGSDSIQFVMSDGVAVSAPATISIPVAPWRNLVEWEFITTSTNGQPQVLTSSSNAAGMLSSTISIGSGMSYRIDQAMYTTDALSITGAGSSTFQSTDYIQWIVQPAPNRQMSMDQITTGLWTPNTASSFSSELRWSDDGFVTWHTVPRGTDQVKFYGRGTEMYKGTPFVGNLSVFSALQNCTKPITFRLYVWGIHDGSNYNNFAASGIGKIGETRPDLVVSGSVAELSFGNWASGVNWQGNDSSQGGDPDNDGLTNKLEFLLGRDPVKYDNLYSSQSIVDDGLGSQYISVEFRRRKEMIGIIAQSSTDLSSWTNLVVDGTNVIQEIVNADPLGNGTVEDIRLKVKFDAGETKKFVRLIGQ